MSARPQAKRDAIARIAKTPKKTTGKDIPVPEGADVTPRGMVNSPEALSGMVE